MPLNYWSYGDCWITMISGIICSNQLNALELLVYTDCVEDYSNFIECTQLFVLYSFIDVKMGLSSFSVYPVLCQWYFQASEYNIAEMAWLAFILVASSAPGRMITDYTLIQRRLLPHYDHFWFILWEKIPRASFNKKESLLDIAYHVVGDLYRQ